MIKSLIDTDLYLLTQSQAAFIKHPDVISKFELIFRKGINYGKF